MQQKHLFEYAVVRVVPRVEREEFLNVGVVLYCAKEKFLQMKFHVDGDRLQSFCATCDVGEITTYLQAFERIAMGAQNAGPIAALGIAERFRWLTATRSTVVQTSRVHPGICDNAAAMLQKLFDQLVA